MGKNEPIDKGLDWKDPYDYRGNKEPFVFISYSHADGEYVRLDIERLTDAGVRLWYDKAIDEGEEWKLRVHNCINDSNCIGACFYLSENSVQSKAIAFEVEKVLEKREVSENFHITSILFGNFTAFSLLLKTCSQEDAELAEDRYRLFLKAFPKENKFFTRSTDYANESHLHSMIKRFEEWNARNRSVKYSDPSLFDCEDAPDGLHIIRYNGASSYLKIPSVLESKRVVGIGISAFEDKKDLKEVIITEGIETIGESCFRNCTGLEQISLPTSLRTVGYEAFRGCRALKEINFSKHLRELGDYCFYLCKNLSSVSFDPGIKDLTLGFCCFQECDSLSEIVLPSKAKELQKYCFNKCEILERITMPTEIDQMDSIVIHNCPRLHTVDFPGRLPTDYQQAFIKHCYGLKSVISLDETLPPETEQGINQNGGEHLTRPSTPEFTIGDDLSIHIKPLAHATGFKASIRLSDVTKACPDLLLKYQKTESDFVSYLVFTKNKDNEYTVTSSPTPTNKTEIVPFAISLQTCCDKKGFAPSNWSSPQDYYNKKAAFVSAENHPEILLRYVGREKEITLPDRFTKIGAEAFAYNDFLQSIHFSDNLTEIDTKAFYYCKSLKQIDWGDSSLRTIGEHAFAYCFGLTELTLPPNVQTLGDGAFEVCKEIVNVDMSNCYVSEIPFRAFRRCVALQTVRFSPNLLIIRQEAFRGCTALRPDKFPDGLKNIENTAFSFLMDADTIMLPANIKEVAGDFLYYSTGVATIQLSGENKHYAVKHNTLIRNGEDGDMAVTYPINAAAQEYQLPQGVTAVGKTAFRDIEHMRFCELGDEVNEIQDDNFSFCWKLERVRLGKKIKTVGNDCFSHNAGLNELILDSTEITIGKNSFVSNAEDFHIVLGEGVSPDNVPEPLKHYPIRTTLR